MSLEDREDYETLCEDQLRKRSHEDLVYLPSLLKLSCGSSQLPISSAWSSAANPFSTSTRFAVGLAGKVCDISDDEDVYDLTTVCRLNDLIFSVDWLDHNTIISGGRRGEVILWDTRSDGENMRFRYPAQINHIRKLEGTRIAIAGIDESVSPPPYLIPSFQEKYPNNTPPTRIRSTFKTSAFSPSQESKNPKSHT